MDSFAREMRYFSNDFEGESTLPGRDGILPFYFS